MYNSEIFSAFESLNEGEGNFSEMTCDPLNLIYLGVADVDNCFHRIKIKENLGRYVVLSGAFNARELGVVGHVYDGRVLTPDSLVRVRCAALPMGFGWSLYFAQRINETVMSESDKLAHSALINDDHQSVFFDPRSPELHYFVYVDNLGVLAMEESQALAVMGDIDSLFPERGLLLHEASCGSGRRESLGTILDCARHATMLSPKRFHRLYQGIRALLRRKGATGMALEIIIGHCTFCSLIDRRLLSLFLPHTSSSVSAIR